MGTFHGFYRGLVLSNADPEKRGRLILQVPQVLGMRPTTWALPCWPAGWNRSLMHDHVFIDNDTGDNAAGSKTETLRHKLLIAVPGAGATVWVTFENGDPGSPVWVGMGTNTQIADALLGTDSDAGAGESGDGTPIGDGTQVPSAYNSPPLSTSTTPTHEHVYPVDSVNGKTGTVSLSIADVPGLVPWSRIEAAPETATRWPAWAEVTGKPIVATLDGTQTFTGTNTFSLAPVVPDGSWTIAKTTGLKAELDSKASTTSLSNYVTLDGAQTVTGVKNFSAGVYDGVARVYSPVNPAPGGLLVPNTGDFFWDGENMDGWEKFGGDANSTAVHNVNAGYTGKGGMQFNGAQWWVWKENIPYDPFALYEGSVLTYETVGTDNSILYFGFAGVAADGVTYVNLSGLDSTGSQHYYIANGQNPPASWQQWTGRWAGNGLASRPGIASAYHSVRYWRPLMYLNYASGTVTGSELLVDSWSVRRRVNDQRTGWVSLTYVNGWVDYGAPYYSGQYMKDSNGFVHFRGLIKGGTSGDIATMPTGYRLAPNGGTTHAMMHFPIRTGDGLNTAHLHADGRLTSAYFGPNWVDLSSVPAYLAEA